MRNREQQAERDQQGHRDHLGHTDQGISATRQGAHALAVARGEAVFDGQRGFTAGQALADLATQRSDLRRIMNLEGLRPTAGSQDTLLDRPGLTFDGWRGVRRAEAHEH